MDKKIIFSFIGGAGIGAAVSWYVTKKICDEQKEKEIEDVKNVYSNLKKSPVENSEETIPEEKTYEGEKPPITDYASVLQNTGYIPPNAPLRPGAPEKKKKRKKGLEFITENEFGENEEYDLITLTYYANDVLCDDLDEPIEDRYAVVPHGFETRFRDNDAVYVVNRRHKAYYEILKDESDYDSSEHPTRIEVS